MSYLASQISTVYQDCTPSLYGDQSLRTTSIQYPQSGLPPSKNSFLLNLQGVSMGCFSRLTNRMAPGVRKGILALTALLLFLLFCMNYCSVGAQPTVDEGPMNAAVHISQEVTFICDLRNIDGYGVFWYHKERNAYLTNGR